MNNEKKGIWKIEYKQMKKEQKQMLYKKSVLIKKLNRWSKT